MAAPNSQEPIVFEMDGKVLQSGASPSDRFVYSSYFKPTTIKPLPADADPLDVEVLKQILGSELGLLFLDRTRIRPTGFSVGSTSSRSASRPVRLRMALALYFVGL